MRRTSTQDYIKIEQAKDLEMVVNVKRHLKRVNKKKQLDVIEDTRTILLITF